MSSKQSLAHTTHEPRREATRTVKAKKATCDGCGARLPVRELLELTEDNHYNLTYCDNDLLCRECCDAAGVLY
jgi:hypothetical protein